MKLVHRHYGHALAVVCVVATTADAQLPTLQTRMLDLDRVGVISNHTTHAIPREDPELIVWAVKRVLSR
jgi:hypothetical protein